MYRFCQNMVRSAFWAIFQQTLFVTLNVLPVWAGLPDFSLFNKPN
jgi:hypothetical protein